MNRPKLEDYGSWDKCKEGWQRNLKSVEYRMDLEKYCDKLENALDIACDMLETYDLANNELTRKKHTQKEWKEWCLKNE